jgi:hypothetical protein
MSNIEINSLRGSILLRERLTSQSVFSRCVYRLFTRFCDLFALDFLVIQRTSNSRLVVKETRNLTALSEREPRCVKLDERVTLSVLQSTRSADEHDRCDASSTATTFPEKPENVQTCKKPNFKALLKSWRALGSSTKVNGDRDLV